MRMTQEVLKILSQYEGENPGVKQNLARILMHGKLAGTGKMVILAVDQGFEHGPEHLCQIQQRLTLIIIFNLLLRGDFLPMQPLSGG